jgi:hypothetical protein
MEKLHDNFRRSAFHIILDNRLYAVWEKCEALTFSIYNATDNWVETRPSNAPQILHEIIEGSLEALCELDAIARDITAEDKRVAESRAALGKSYAEAIGRFERDQLNKRLGEIVRSPHKPPAPTK